MRRGSDRVARPGPPICTCRQGKYMNPYINTWRLLRLHGRPLPSAAHAASPLLLDLPEEVRLQLRLLRPARPVLCRLVPYLARPKQHTHPMSAKHVYPSGAGSGGGWVGWLIGRVPPRPANRQRGRAARVEPAAGAAGATAPDSHPRTDERVKLPHTPQRRRG